MCVCMCTFYSVYSAFVLYGGCIYRVLVFNGICVCSVECACACVCVCVLVCVPPLPSPLEGFHVHQLTGNQLQEQNKVERASEEEEEEEEEEEAGEEDQRV